MREYTLKIELLSDVIFGSGMSVPGGVDLEVLHDSYGLPYMQGKTIKGKLREEARNVSRWINMGMEDNELISNLFGAPDRADIDSLMFSNVTLNKSVYSILRSEVESDSSITADDILKALTGVRNHTRIEEKTGRAKKGSLRSIQVINKGLIFYCSIGTNRELTKEEESLLCAAVASLRHLGVNETRGKGEVECKLYDNGEDITTEGIRRLLEKEEKK